MAGSAVGTLGTPDPPRYERQQSRNVTNRKTGSSGTAPKQVAESGFGLVPVGLRVRRMHIALFWRGRECT